MPFRSFLFCFQRLTGGKCGKLALARSIMVKCLVCIRVRSLLTFSSGKCEMCGDTVCCLRPSGWDVAHNIARNKGGSMMLENLRVSCPACNRYTGTLPFDEEKRRRQEEAHTQRPVVFDSNSSSADDSDNADEGEMECCRPTPIS